MATTLSVSLPSVPSSFDKSNPAVIKGSLSTPVKKNLELLGPKFQAFVRRRFHNRTHSEDEKIQQEIYGSGEAELDDFSDDEEETSDLADLDPRDWKSQDHYKVLGLSKYRYKASDAQIKAAFHKKVLRHHPDKKAAAGNTNDDAFFKCIQKAHEILTDPVKRRQFDSVDEFYPETFPSAKAQGDFFELWTPVFEREGRFSKKQPVPSLGNLETPRQEVEDFYNFMYNLESWRSFEYLDKEDADSDNRDNKRWLDRKNKADRAQRTKEHNARVLKLIDTAFSVDPRIKLFKEEDKARRSAKKNTKSTKEQQAAEAKARKEEEERIAKEKAEEEAKVAKAATANKKKEKEAKRGACRMEKKNIRGIFQSANCLLASEPSAEQSEAQLQKLESIFEKIGVDPEALIKLKERLQAAISSDSASTFLESEQ